MSKVIIERYFLGGPSSSKPSVQFFIMDGKTPRTQFSFVVDLSGTDFEKINFKNVITDAILNYVNDPKGLNLKISKSDIYNIPQ